MHSRNQNKPPMTLSYNPSRSPLINKGEVLDEVQSCERRKICGGKAVCPAASTRSRPPLSIVNEVSVSACSVPASISSNGESKENQHEFMSREDVEKLLAEKPRPERKSDLKGGLEKMQGHVKNLKTCIRWYMDREDRYLREQEKLQSMLESENRRHSHAEAQMSCKIDDLTLLNEELQRHNLTLEESLRKEEACKLHSQQEAAELRDELENEVCCLRSELQLVSVDRDHQLELVESMSVGLKKYEEFIAISSRDIDEALRKAEETSSSQQDQIKSLCYQLSAANEKLKKTDLALNETIQENEAKKKLVNELQNHIIDLECQLVEAEKLRKKLHNTILELKGNIRVFCRVRPTLHGTHSSGADGTIMSYPTGIEYLGRGIDLMYNDQNLSFTFDKVFGPEASQEDVFVEIAQLVQSALDGYKVCIFAYGQTGSGKTYTMMGNPEAHEQKGLIPRSLEQIFETSQALKWQGWKYKMQASLLEIYNETIRDLLSPSKSSSTDATHNKQFTIKHDSAGNTHVSDLTVVDVCSINEVSFLLKQAAQSRSIGKTQMNEESSRSHFVFTLRISRVNELTKQQVQGVLNLIDLAGSERLAKSGSTGDRMKEAQAINKSLSSLSDVIFAIAKEEDHVPYRNSKLTYLLKPCLGGDSKTLMFVNISPEASSANESICSLRFATRVNACEIKMPRRHSQMRPSIPD